MDEAKVAQRICAVSTLNNKSFDNHRGEVDAMLESAPRETILLATKYLTTYNLIMFIDKFGLPSEEIWAIRHEADKRVLNDKSGTYNRYDKRAALSELLFSLLPFHAGQRIEEIRIAAKSKPEVQEKFAAYEPLLMQLQDIFKEDSLDSMTDEQFDKILDKIDAECEKIGKPLSDVLDELFTFAKDSFRTEVDQRTKDSADHICDGIKPTVKKSSDGKDVNVYHVAKQGKAQQAFTLLGRSMDPTYIVGKTMDEFLAIHAQHKDEYSFSVYTQNNLASFASKCDRVILAYDGLGGADVLMCGVSDGQVQRDMTRSSSASTFIKTFLSVDDFCHNTTKYNEVLLSHIATIRPRYIITRNPEASQRELDIAAKMGLDIIYFDPEVYKPRDKEDMPTEPVFDECWRRTPLSGKVLSNPMPIDVSKGLIHE